MEKVKKMRITDLIAMCLRNLFRRKVRTILTVLGVVIGTASIVVMMSLGVGLNSNFEADMENYMDVKSITVRLPSADQTSRNLKLDDKVVEKIGRLDHVNKISPLMVLNDVAIISCGRYNYLNNEIIAMDLNQLKETGYETTEGSLMEKGAPKNGIYFGYGSDYQFIDPNATGSPEYEMDEEYKYVDPPPVDVMTTPVTISVNSKNTNSQEGTGENGTEGKEQSQDSSSGNTSNTGNNSSSEVDNTGGSTQSKPLTTLGKLKEDYSKEGAYYGVIISLEMGRELQREYNAVNGVRDNGNNYTVLKVKVDDIENVPGVEEEIKAMGFQTESAEQFRDAMSQQASLIQVILGGLGAISLFVASLGITNTMIMSIYERTREIGVMKVLGCRLRDIRMMFLFEAGSIGFLGGVVGIIFSYLLSFIVNTIVGSMEGMNLHMKISIIPFWLVLLGMGFAVGVGLIAGFSPANRAVKISPLSAIRQD